jgi:Tol biopolymer transport system component
VWAPDSKHIVFRRMEATGKVRLYWTRADGSGALHMLMEVERECHPQSFSPDGRSLTYTAANGNDHDIWMLPLDLTDAERPRAGTPQPLVKTPAREVFHAMSPDGRWIAYESFESGSIEIYVKSVRADGGRWQVSTKGGMFPVWSRNGRELFYQTNARINVVDYSVRGDSFQLGKPRVWSDRELRRFINTPNADLHPDGKRFIVTLPSEEGGLSSRLAVLVNFGDELRRRVPLP